MKKQNLNIGDKLLCKKSIHAYFNKDEYYYIGDIRIINTFRYEEYIYEIKIDNVVGVSIGNDITLYNHFYKKNEVRRIKLKTLNEKSEY